MASVKSLGLHYPSGLRHAIDEQILPENPPADSYKWTVNVDDSMGKRVEDELFVTSTCVIWSRGGLVRKTFKFDVEKELITQALFAYFPASSDDSHDKKGAKGEPRPRSARAKALVVFFKTNAHIYFLSGTSHTIHMPFEVESACAGPIGIIIQRKQKAEGLAPVSLKFPRVPPNSFLSSQPTISNLSQHSTFSVETLGKPKALNLGLGSTIGNMWDARLEQPESSWPRLVSLTDPLQDIGLVVTDGPDGTNTRDPKRENSKRPNFLHSSEELMHVEQVTVGNEPMTLAVTVQREAGTYTVWRLSYLEQEDPFIKRKKTTKQKGSRRRSSMQPLTNGRDTPVHPNIRESFGAPLPGKRHRKSEKIEKPLDLVTSLEQQDNEDAGAKRRSSRRVSSMLARADLSASHERPVFTEQPHIPGHNTSKRHDSNGSQYGRLSSHFNQQIHPSLGSLLEAPFDMGLDEGFNNMGLDDQDFEGLQKEVQFTKIHSMSLDQSNLRYSVRDNASRNQCRVFMLMSPPFACNEPSRHQLLIGIQDLVEKRLNFIRLYLTCTQKSEGTITASKRGNVEDSSDSDLISISAVEQIKVQNVVDSCKLVDGDHAVVLVLSESMDGRHELSTQAPWSELTKVSVSLLFTEDTRSLQYQGRSIDRDVRQRRSEVIDFSNGSIVGLIHPRGRGIVDVVDTDGRLHQLQVQIQPSCPQVRKVLNSCSGILPDSLGVRIHAGWMHVMQWLRSRGDPAASSEWSGLVILILSMFLNLGRVETQIFQTTRLPVRKKRPAFGSFGSIKESEDWKALEVGETVHSLGYPVWMMNKGWEVALDEDLEDPLSSQNDSRSNPKFTSKHIALAKEFMNSKVADAALGNDGYLPTALNRGVESRRRVAVDLFMGLHLLLEEQKLDIMTPEYASPGRVDLRVLLCQIARWLKWADFWSVYELGVQEDIDQRHDSELNLIPSIPQPPLRPDIFLWIQSRLTREGEVSYPTPADIFYTGLNLPKHKNRFDPRWDEIVPRTLILKRFFRLLKRDATAVDMVETMYECGMTTHFLETLPEAILVPFKDAISLCQPRPPSYWSRDLLDFVKRGDISLILEPTGRPRPAISNILTPTHVASWDTKLLCQSVDESNASFDEGEGTERQAVIRALFKEDRRLNEVQDLLSTHKSRVVHLDPQPDWSESVYLEMQKELASRIATGTLAIPAGRGLLYYSLRFPLITQKFHIGGFNLNCIVRPANVTVGVDKTLFTEEKVCWGFFHQGVAAGLAISPQAKGIDSSWILYNKPGQELSNRHAGFLLALGLNGHLKGIAKWVAFKYLTPKHTMTSIGLLLGLAASYIGTMDSLITRLLSVHATRMLPRGAAELNLSPLTQTSGIMGIGLLYCNSQHRRMSEIMLSEIEHIDEEDEEEPLRSECYRLAASFSLGLINLGNGNDLKGLHDMKLTEKLLTYATSTKKVELVHILDRAAAGAVMAIALIFMKSEDQIVARKIDVPDSILQFDYVRPDILLLRTVAKHLILWSKIQPTFAWIQKNLPAAYRPRYKLTGTTKLRSTDLPFFSILAGICFSIALRYAGSASHRVRDLLLHYLEQFMRITRIPPTLTDHPDATPPYDEELARSNARMCQDILAISAAIVMAGTGDIPVLRRLRALHGRDDPETPYGSHLAAHLAIGALFLGCGTATFGTSNLAIASLLIAFYPIFPNDVMDNRSHLQAFRHFWVLATEQRCLVVKDVLTGQPVSVAIQIKLRQQTAASSAEPVLYRTTPCLLPPLDQISLISTDAGHQFWDVELDFSSSEVREAFQKTQSIYLKRRPLQDAAFTSTLRALGRDNKDPNPLDWVFGLEALKEVSYAERSSVLETGEERHETGLSVDAKLEMERGILDSVDRERLENARLLFEWGGARESLLQSKGPSVHDSQATEKADAHDEERTLEEEGSWWMRDSVVENLKGKVMLAGREDEQ
ncbi:unnamed protein product [Clonostachys rosea f. rosea IK726]|uniref:Anaphase-promoting complex subunit 1 N-terminal domain-containing protein n=2 Tax=Bionectria ochroleuca TaxID=29856 RepID=A0A0B7JVQ7_BIOOC|nr:unnamed protein product [Clonostachys rosea f. rosea IK726]